MHSNPVEFAGSQYNNAAALFTQMDNLRRVWAGFRPLPPLTRSDLMMLGTVDKLSHQGAGPVTIGGLARHMQQSAPGISQKVSMLEELGYLTRTTDKADRRVAYIALTPKGAKAAKMSMREFFGRMEKALAALGEEKTHTLIALMEELSTSIQKVQGDENIPQGGNNV